jgi:hypothetical protein
MERERPDPLGLPGMPQLREQSLLLGRERVVGRRLMAEPLQALEQTVRIGAERFGDPSPHSHLRIRGLSPHSHVLAARELGEANRDVGRRAVAAGVGVEDAAAAEGVGGRDRAHDDAVVAAGDQGALAAQLVEMAAEPRDAGRALAGAVVDVDARAVLDPRVELDIEDVRRLDRLAREDVAAHRVGVAQVDRDALARRGALHALVVDLDLAHARASARWEHQQLVTAADRA